MKDDAYEIQSIRKFHGDGRTYGDIMFMVQMPNNTRRKTIEIAVKSICLSCADLRHDDLSGLDLSDVDLSRSNLRFANLSNCNLTNANLCNAELSYANLTGAILTNAKLQYANFNHVRLEDGIFDGCDLTNCIVGRLSYE